jgi:hypothetical protein
MEIFWLSPRMVKNLYLDDAGNLYIRTDDHYTQLDWYDVTDISICDSAKKMYAKIHFQSGNIVTIPRFTYEHSLIVSKALSHMEEKVETGNINDVCQN